MRTLAKNKQKMYYSHFINSTTEYEMDGEEIIYIEVDGEQVPVEQGSIVEHHDMPVEFSAVISSELNALRAATYGVDQSSIYSEICVSKGALNLTIGDIVWRTSQIKYNADGYPDESSADYKVMGLMTEGLHEDYFLLQRMSVA